MKPKTAKKPGTAVAIDDPRRRQHVARRQATQPSNFLAVIMQAATNPACDVGKMQALLDMQKQIEERDAKKAFTAAFVKLQAELPEIDRDGKIEVRAKDQRTGERTGKLQQSTPYATYPAIMKVVRPLLKKHGFTLSSVVEPEAERIAVVSYLDHEAGHGRTSRFPLPAETSGSKNNVQGWGSSQQYGMRYNAIALLNIVSRKPADADADGHEGEFVKSKDGGLAQSTEVETLNPAELGQLTRKIADCKVPIEKVLKHFGIEAIGDLPRTLFQTALKDCDDYAANQEKARQERAAAGSFPGDRISTGGQREPYRR